MPPSADYLFLAHAPTDEPLARQLRQALERTGLHIAQASPEVPGQPPPDKVKDLVQAASGTIVLLTRHALTTAPVQQALGWGGRVQRSRKDYRIVILLRGFDDPAVTFRAAGTEYVYLKADGSMDEVVPEILDALGRSGDASGAVVIQPPPPVDEMVIELAEPRFSVVAGIRRCAATCTITHRPAAGPPSTHGPFDFSSPVGEDETARLRWYLAEFPLWPFGAPRRRSQGLESEIPLWARELLSRTLGHHPPLVDTWRTPSGAEKLVVVEVQGLGPATPALLSLPWELIPEFFRASSPNEFRPRLVRRLAGGDPVPPPIALKPIRILAVQARPDLSPVPAGDPSQILGDLATVVRPLGPRMVLEVLPQSTLVTLQDVLLTAARAGRPFHVVHLDVPTVHEPLTGLGSACFEDGDDVRAGSLTRKPDVVSASVLGALLQESRVQLVVVHAGPAGPGDEDAPVAVAAELHLAGVPSVLTMTTVLFPEASHAYLNELHRALSRGATISAAHAEGYLGLMEPGRKGYKAVTPIKDWMVPILLQREGGDEAFVPEERLILDEDSRRREVDLEGALPGPIPFGLVGRIQERLTLERTLANQRVVCLTGCTGQGKTALAASVARSMLLHRRVDRVAYVSLDDLFEPRAVLDRIGRQVSSDWSLAAVEGEGTTGEKLVRARAGLARLVAERSLLVVVDDLEVVLPGPGQPVPTTVRDVWDLLAHLAAIGRTRMLLVSQEPPPPSLTDRVVPLPGLTADEGRALLARVLRHAHSEPRGEDEEWIEVLVEVVEGHPRSLLLLVPFLAEVGIQLTAQQVLAVDRELETRRSGAPGTALLVPTRMTIDRMPGSARARLRGFAVFRQVAPLEVAARVLQTDLDEVTDLALALQSLGLAQVRHGHVLLDPGLAPVLSVELSRSDWHATQGRWLEAMLGYVGALLQRLRKDPQTAAQSVLLTLQELMAVVAVVEDRVRTRRLAPDEARGQLSRLESLLGALGLPLTQAQVAEVRHRLA